MLGVLKVFLRRLSASKLYWPGEGIFDHSLISLRRYSPLIVFDRNTDWAAGLEGSN